MARSSMILCLAAALAGPATASPYQLSRTQEVWLTGAGIVGLGLGRALYTGRHDPAPADLAVLDAAAIPAAERSWAGHWDSGARRLSDLALYGSLATPLLALLPEQADAPVVGVMYLETLLLTNAGVSLAKGSVHRYRPFAYGEAAPLDYRTDADATRSFFSGHAANISASLVFSAKVYADHNPDDPSRAFVWTAALGAAAWGSWQRVEAGWHFPTDVLLGAAWGGLIGYGVPALHRSPRWTKVQPLLYKDGIGVRVALP